MAEAVGAIETFEGNFERHRIAARDLAAEYFDARTVVTKLLETVYATR
jgi:hypothetical protein